MGSLLRSVKKRKKSRRLGEVEMVRHEDYGELALEDARANHSTFTMTPDHLIRSPRNGQSWQV